VTAADPLPNAPAAVPDEFTVEVGGADREARVDTLAPFAMEAVAAGELVSLSEALVQIVVEWERVGDALGVLEMEMDAVVVAELLPPSTRPGLAVGATLRVDVVDTQDVGVEEGVGLGGALALPLL
jgi:hypothetical protein